MESYEPYLSLGMALAAGLLVGLEREQAQTPDYGSFLGGARTFPLFALLGALAVLVGRTVAWLAPVVFVTVVALVAISYSDDVRKERDRGLTNEAALLVTFLLGALASSQSVIEPLQRRLVVVAALAVAVTFLLGSKPKMSVFLRNFSRDDLFSLLKFLIVAVVVLPLLPDETVGPLGVINPFNVGLMIVLIAGISFAGWVASRLFGKKRGLVAAALIGGLVSSTAVTLSFAGRVKKEAGLARLAAAAIVLASAVMFVRILVEVAVVHAPLVRPLALPLAAMTVAGLGAGLYLYRGRSAAAELEAAPLRNPVELASAIRFGLIFAAVLLAAKAAQVYFGPRGIYLAAFAAGTTDVDAITLSTARLAQGGLAPTVAVTTILIGAASNTAVKTGIAFALGSVALGRRVLIAMLVIIAAGALSAALLWLR
jgi:uncharacterized membrane protein (DUF4010 family)